jgi:hypothetical protein
MASFKSLSLLLLGLAASSVIANPLPQTPLEPWQIYPCMAIRCMAGYPCVNTGLDIKTCRYTGGCIPEAEAAVLEPCGDNISCPTGSRCCDKTRGICTPVGTSCPRRDVCKIGKICGNTTCLLGQECCQPSCGLCVAAGAPCPLIACVDA